MAASASYRLLVSEEAFHVLLALGESERQKLVQASRSLAENPFTPGDYSETDDDGFMNDIVLKGRFIITFRADHAAKELRLIRIERA